MERLTVIEFVEVVEEIFQANDYNPEFVHQVLANDENSTDEELLQYFEENGEVCPANWKSGDAGMTASPDGVASYLSENADKL